MMKDDPQQPLPRRATRISRPPRTSPIRRRRARRPTGWPSTTPISCCRDELRPVRLQLELLKPEMMMAERGIELDRRPVRRRPHSRAGATRAPRETQTLSELSEILRRGAHLRPHDDRAVAPHNGHRENVIVTGGGPGVMEAGNRGAEDAGGVSIGLNIVLPHEQAPNEYVTPELCFNFHYFAIRKMHFLMRATAIAVFPGGFGTLDELFESADPDPDRSHGAGARPAVRRGVLAQHHQLGRAGARPARSRRKIWSCSGSSRRPRRPWPPSTVGTRATSGANAFRGDRAVRDEK